MAGMFNQAAPYQSPMMTQPVANPQANSLLSQPARLAPVMAPQGQAAPQTPTSTPVAPPTAPPTVPATPAPSAAPQTMTSGQSMYGQAASSPASMQNFLQALNQAGAGSNNNFQNTQQAPAPQIAPLIGQTPASNGTPTVSQSGLAPSLPIGASPMPGLLNGAFGSNNLASATTPPTRTLDSLQRPVSPAPAAPMMNANIARLNSVPQSNLLVSDEDAKTDIEPADAEVHDFLGGLGVHSYKYKDTSNGMGRFISPMAQELERTPVGKSAVVETPKGKMVDYSRLAGIMLSAQADAHQRLKKLEGK